MLFYQPGLLLGGTIEHDCNPQRSIGYYLEGLLMLAAFMKTPLKATLKGVTNDPTDPSVSIWSSLDLIGGICRISLKEYAYITRLSMYTLYSLPPNRLCLFWDFVAYQVCCQPHQGCWVDFHYALVVLDCDSIWQILYLEEYKVETSWPILFHRQPILESALSHLDVQVALAAVPHCDYEKV